MSIPAPMPTPTSRQNRYFIGIDLGTTNCALSYVDRRQPDKGSQVLPIPQQDSATSVLTAPQLPSFAFLPADAQQGSTPTSEHGLPLLESGWVPGTYARAQLAFNPGRVIHSAKSWLCHGNVDRTEAILPWQSQEISFAKRLSPVAASALYLRWLRAVWDQTMAAEDDSCLFEHQHIVITIPASFNEVAQELTLKAAQQAGYPEHLRLIEEPQAAFYFWLGRNKNLSILHDMLTAAARPTLKILVCDIGGGTTDLSLFQVSTDKQVSTGLKMERLAVSEHLLLGGDNIDLTLAHVLEHKLMGEGKRASSKQWSQLLAQARDLKERILATDPDAENEAKVSPQSFPVTVSGSGSGLFSSAKSFRVEAHEIRACILEGFFPHVEAQERPHQDSSGLQEWGLPYAQDSAISRHLAYFLDGQSIDAVLFNGGSVTPEFLRRRLHHLLQSWQQESGPALRELHNDAISLAVSRGAARYCWIVSQSDSERIAGGYPHSLYLEVHGRRKKERQLVCILPKGMEAGHSINITEPEFDLLVNQPVRFQCCYALKRQQDRPGTLVPWNRDEFRPLPTLETAIHLREDQPRPANNRVRVHLEVSLNELGLLQIYCVAQDGSGRWRLDFNLRKGVEEEQEDAGQIPSQSVVPSKEALQALQVAMPCIDAVYARKKHPELPDIKPAYLPRELERHLGKRDTWNSATLRQLWPALNSGMTRKTRSIEHENTWLYLAGFTLRPGYGVNHDESRMEQLWRVHQLGMAFPKEKRIQKQWYLLWRRVAGGLNRQRQQQLLDAILPTLQNQSEPEPEMVYLAGALELLLPETKCELVKIFGKRLLQGKLKHTPPYTWALGRLLSRTPLYAGRETIIHPREVNNLFESMEHLDWSDAAWGGLNAMFAQASRCTEQRDIDVEAELRERIGAKLKHGGAAPHQIEVVKHYVAVDDADRILQFGETLPAGLILAGSTTQSHGPTWPHLRGHQYDGT
ncbi:MAG: Hsp70 family protein [Desulfuromonas sp.]|nr:Hsp70 family protein [Desulfuromonas sp.]